MTKSNKQPDGNGEDDTIGLADRGGLGTFSTIATCLVHQMSGALKMALILF